MKNTKFIIITSTLLISFIFFYIGKNSFKNEIENKNPKRILLSEDKTKKICSKVTEDFQKKYALMNYVKKEDSWENENDKDFIEFLKDESFSNASTYLKYLLFRYSLFIIADFILIFCWVCYCSCCCNPCCCCKGEQGCCSKFSYMFSILMFIGLIAIGVIGIIYGHPLKQNFIEAGCSVFKLFDHFENGFKDDFEKSKEWIGLNNIYSLLNDSENIYNLTLDSDNIKTNLENECKNIDKASCDLLEKAYNIINNMKDNYNSDTKTIKDSNNQINKFQNGLKDIEDKYINDAYDYLDNYMIKYSHCYIIIFVLVLAFGLLGFLFLAAYVHTCECIKCLYVILWNIESLFMIVIVLLGVSFGLLSALSQNIISAVRYSTTSDNFNNSNPIIFNEDLFSVCFNEDGVLNGLVLLNSSVNENLKGLLEVKDSIEEVFKKNNKLIEKLETLYIIVNETYNLFNNYGINNSISDVINCTFMDTDINIFIDEVKDNLIETSKKMEIIIYAASLCAGLSIIFGIIVINRYKKKEKKKNKDDLDATQPEGKHIETERKKINEKNNEK